MLLDFIESVGNAVNNGIQGMGSGAHMSGVSDADVYLEDIANNTYDTARTVRRTGTNWRNVWDNITHKNG